MLEGEGRKGWHIRVLGVFKGETSTIEVFFSFPWLYYGTCYFRYHRHVHRIGSDRMTDISLRQPGLLIVFLVQFPFLFESSGLHCDGYKAWFLFPPTRGRHKGSGQRVRSAGGISCGIDWTMIWLEQ